MRWQTVVVALLLGAAVAGCTTAPAPVLDTPPPPSTPAPAAADAAEVRALLATARTVETRPDVPGYDRDCGPAAGCVFGTSWTDDTSAPLGHNGCDTRNDVLGLSLVDVAFDPGTNDCKVVAGHLVDPFTGVVLDFATQGSDIHVDHLFPLAAAWDLGASSWTAARRAAFANDPRLELLAVSGAANLAKGDSTPASWLPPNRTYRCTYVAGYLRVAVAYDLAVTAADVRVIEAVVLKSCPRT